MPIPKRQKNRKEEKKRSRENTEPFLFLWAESAVYVFYAQKSGQAAEKTGIIRKIGNKL